MTRLEDTVKARSTSRRIALLTAVASAVLALGCEDPLSQDASVILVTTTLDRDTIRPGEPLGITVTATNPTRRRVQVTTDGCFLLYEVRNSAGTRVSPAWLCLAIEMREIFEPGEVKKAEFVWTGETEHYINRQFVAEPVDPGSHEVVGFLHSPVVLRSEPRRVEVLPAFILSLTVEPSTARAGDTVALTAELVNQAPRPMTLDILSTCTFAVWAELSGVPYALVTPCERDDRRLSLAPGQGLKETMQWQVSKPGFYRLIAQVGAPTLEPKVRATATLTVTTRG